MHVYFEMDEFGFNILAYFSQDRYVKKNLFIDLQIIMILGMIDFLYKFYVCFYVNALIYIYIHTKIESGEKTEPN